MEKYFLIILFATGLLFTGCGEDTPSRSKLRLSTTEVNFSAVDKSSKQVTVSTSYVWEYDYEVLDWVTVQRGVGDDDNKLEITVTTNLGSQREVVVYITAADEIKTLNIIQYGVTEGTVIMELDPETHTFEATDAEPFEITVTTNLQQWDVHDDPEQDWAAAVRQEDIIIISATDNTEYDQRIATITITGEDNYQKTFTVRQLGIALPQIIPSTTSVTIYPLNPRTEEVIVELIDIGDGWTATSTKPEWASVSTVYEDSQHKLLITVTENNLLRDKETVTADVTLSPPEGSLGSDVTIKVSQPNLWQWLQQSFNGTGNKKFNGEEVSWTSAITRASGELEEVRLIAPNFNGNKYYDLYLTYDEETGELSLDLEDIVVGTGNTGKYNGYVRLFCDWMTVDNEPGAYFFPERNLTAVYDFEQYSFSFPTEQYMTDNGLWPIGMRILGYWAVTGDNGEPAGSYANIAFGDAIYNVKFFLPQSGTESASGMPDSSIRTKPVRAVPRF